MDTRLIELLVCPVCKGPLQRSEDRHSLICHADRLAFPIRDGIPVMLESEAVSLDASPQGSGQAAAPADLPAAD